jgi:hypothetical protein
MEQYTLRCLYCTLHLQCTVHIPFTPAAKTFFAQAETFSTALLSEKMTKYVCTYFFIFVQR